MKKTERIVLDKNKKEIILLAVFLLLIIFLLLLTRGYLYQRIERSNNYVFSHQDSVILFKYAFFLFVAAVVVMFFGITYFVFSMQKRLHVIYPLLALGFGLIYIFAITPISPPDEITHYHAAYRISNAFLFRQDINIADSVYLDYTGFDEANNTAKGYLNVYSKITIPTDVGVDINIGTERTLISHDYIMEYFAPALGIAVARLLRMNFIQTFLLGRIFNLLFFVLCLSFAIRRTPVLKQMFGILCIIPMVLQQAASFSYDAFVIGCSFILISSFFRAVCAQREQTWMDIIVPILFAMLLAPAKGTFYFLMLPALILLSIVVPRKRFAKIKKSIFCSLLILLPLCVFFAFKIPIIQSLYEQNRSITSENITIADAITASFAPNSMLQKGVMVFTAIFNTICFDGIRLLLESTGSVLSGLSLAVPDWITLSFVILLCLSANRISKEQPSFSLKLRSISLLAGVCYFILVGAALYLTWTPTGSIAIGGLQGRYFIPALPFLYMQCNCRLFSIQRDCSVIIGVISTVLSVVCISFILLFTVV